MPPSSPLLQPRQKVLFDAMLDALRWRDAGQSALELWPNWRDATGLSLSRLEDLLQGSCETAAAKAAYAAITADNNDAKIARIAPRMGHVPRLTCEVILEMRTAAKQGTSIESLALRYQTTQLIAHKIVQGEYHTSAMREALAKEQLKPSAEVQI